MKSSEIKGPDLLNELKELIETPKALGEVCSPTSEALDTTVFDFSKLEIPLNICGKACEEFQQKIKQSSSTSGSNDIRYWNELQIMGDNVDHFQQLLCGYKMAFSIALINEDRGVPHLFLLNSSRSKDFNSQIVAIYPLSLLFRAMKPLSKLPEIISPPLWSRSW